LLCNVLPKRSLDHVLRIALAGECACRAEATPDPCGKPLRELALGRDRGERRLQLLLGDAAPPELRADARVGRASLGQVPRPLARNTSVVQVTGSRSSR